MSRTRFRLDMVRIDVGNVRGGALVAGPSAPCAGADGPGRSRRDDGRCHPTVWDEASLRGVAEQGTQRGDGIAPKVAASASR
jgi:hypothetical protein